MKLFGGQKKEPEETGLKKKKESGRETEPERQERETGATPPETRLKKPKRAKRGKTWLHMPRWAVICGAVALLSVAGVVAAKEIIVVPPPVIPAVTPPATVTPQPEFVPPNDVAIDGPAENPAQEPSKVPLGNGLDIGRKEDMYTVLIVGTDGTSNTDTIMVARLDAKNDKLNVMSIPRDTQVNVRRNIKKINAAWAAGGYGKAGMDQLKRELKSVIGFLPDYYVLVDLKCFIRLVDAVGGVWYDVPRSMNYDDPDQNLHIHLEKGYQHLYGAQAIQLVRFRQNNNGTGYVFGDIERLELHQDFLKAVAKQTLQLGNLFKINEFVSIAQEYTDSDLGGGHILWFVEQLMNLDDGDVTFYTLPVAAGAIYNGEDYVLVQEAEALALINETINPYLADRGPDDLDLSRLADRWR